MSRRGTARVVAGVLVGGLLLGVVCGVLWEWWWTPPAGVAVDGEFVFTSAGIGEGFSGTGLYVLVTAAGGLALGTVAALRGDGREVPVLLALLAASALAGTVTALVGAALGPPDAATRAADLDDYAPLVQDLRVEGAAAWLTFPSAALLAAAVVFLVLTRRRHPEPVRADRAASVARGR
ncbi:hypothetical protein [Nocardioides perillae]|uniref:Uncharacterized protein n=1 Tax=Nocardioides perillae TaxID=1119534 RepID=A0A7Y9UN98_9ACTN|nr:hypothetical protein [Nocardioides perillae]NYG56216.1 hypothetical protein [Nocardioides perillae]